jgi:hypothetical protein
VDESCEVGETIGCGRSYSSSISRMRGSRLADPLPTAAVGPRVALLGTLLVTTTREVVGAVVRTVAAWLSRTGGRTVKMQLGDDSIELTNVAEEDQRQLLEAFLARHTDPAL